jgi:hypothetical protein
MHDLPEVEEARNGRDQGDAAQHTLRRLVDAKAIKLKSGTRVRELARKLARVWKRTEEEARGEALYGWLLEQEEVEEVTAGAWEIAAVAEGSE